MSPSRQKKKMVDSLRLAAVNWAAKLRLGRSSQAEAWTALHTTISRKLIYPLPALTLTEAECISIVSPAILAALPKAGISATNSAFVRHAPRQSLGLEVPNLYLTMGSAHTSLLIERCWQKSQWSNSSRLQLRIMFWMWDSLDLSGITHGLWNTHSGAPTTPGSTMSVPSTMKMKSPSPFHMQPSHPNISMIVL